MEAVDRYGKAGTVKGHGALRSAVETAWNA